MLRRIDVRSARLWISRRAMSFDSSRSKAPTVRRIRPSAFCRKTIAPSSSPQRGVESSIIVHELAWAAGGSALTLHPDPGSPYAKASSDVRPSRRRGVVQLRPELGLEGVAREPTSKASSTSPSLSAGSRCTRAGGGSEPAGEAIGHENLGDTRSDEAIPLSAGSSTVNVEPCPTGSHRHLAARASTICRTKCPEPRQNRRSEHPRRRARSGRRCAVVAQARCRCPGRAPRSRAVLVSR